MAGMDGISYLVAVTQMKANNANDQALHGAEDQRALVKKQEFLRQAQAKFEEMVHDGNYTNADAGKTQALYTAINEQLGVGSVTYGNRTVKGTGENEGKTGDVSDGDQKANQATVESIRSELDKAMKSLEAQDRMGNFEIQRLMSAFNQSETLSSNMQKKADDTQSGVQQKIG